MSANTLVSIDSQTSLDNFTNMIDWEESFIRELQWVSPSYIAQHVGFVAPQAMPDVRMMILLPNDEKLGVEVCLQEVERFCVSNRQSIRISGKVLKHNASVKLRLSYSENDSGFDVAANNILYRFLSTAALGYELKYGYEDIFDRSGKRL